jgi:phosphoribosylanthranilate isomerase
MTDIKTRPLAVKICGVSEINAIKAAAEAGARYVGFVFVERSPRFISADTAKELSLNVPTGLKTVGLFADPTDADFDKILPYVMLDYIQLHGNESPKRVQDIKDKYLLPVIKALPIREAADLKAADDFAGQADMLLLDAQTKAGAFGGTGARFDWQILKDFKSPLPWLLAGGITPENVKEAIDICVNLPQFTAIDVSSGVEKDKAVKDVTLIKQLIYNAFSTF